MDDAYREVEESLKAISKAAIAELKAIAKPHFLVEKVMQIVLALRGYKHINWNTAREFLGKSSMKAELAQITARTLKPIEVLKSQQILIQKTNAMLTPENVNLHSEAAALLLIWAANHIKLYACVQKLGMLPAERERTVIKLDEI